MDQGISVDPPGNGVVLILPSVPFREIRKGLCAMEDTSGLLKDIKQLEAEIEDIKKSIPAHSVKYELIQLLKEKEGQLERKKNLLQR
jgi:hypothetical protein